MAATFLLDTGPLGLLAHNRATLRAPIQNWLVQELSARSIIFISEVADFEVRRELTRLIKAGQLPASRLNRLDELASACSLLPVTTAMWRRAADLWADARLQGLPSAATLDADVLIAAQAAEVGATIVPCNTNHQSR